MTSARELEIREIFRSFNRSPHGHSLDFSTGGGDRDLIMHLKVPELRSGSTIADSDERNQLVESLSNLEIWDDVPTDKALVYFDELTSLRQLSLRDSRLSDAGLDHLQKLQSLESLSLRGTAVTDGGITALQPLARRLHSLSLRDTAVTDTALDKLHSFFALRTLDLSYTKISAPQPLMRLLESLLPEFGKGQLATLCIAGNESLGLDDRVLDETDAGLLYKMLRASLNSDHRPLHEVKVVILGEGEVGKSNLRDRLMGRVPPQQRDRTHDFEVEELTLNVPRPEGCVAVNFRIYDFGGQPGLHGAHRFFLSGSRCIYVLVNRCGGQTPRSSRLKYWVGLIGFSGRGRPGVIVQSWYNEPVPQGWAEFTQQTIDSQVGRYIFPAVIVPEYYDGKSPDADEIRRALVELTSQSDYIFKTTYEPGFFAIMESLERGASSACTGGNEEAFAFDRYCTMDEFRRLCTRAGINDAGRQATMLGIFGDLGRVLYVGGLPSVQNSTAHILKERIMNPQWAKRPVYEVIRDMPLANTHGRAGARQLLERILQRCTGMSEAEAEQSLALMEACGLISPLRSLTQSIEGYLVVDQLPPAGTGVTDNERFESWKEQHVITCDFLGEHVLPRFIGRWYCRLVDPNGCTFRDRAIFKHESDPDVQALVKADLINSRIIIRTRGIGKSDLRQFELRLQIASAIREIMAEDEAWMSNEMKAAPPSSPSLTRMQENCKRAFLAAQDANPEVKFEDRKWMDVFEMAKIAAKSEGYELPDDYRTFAKHCQAAGLRLRGRKLKKIGRSVVDHSEQ